jgi:hypothetical protein
MLAHVTANQTRFVAPGLSPDSRGIALGRFGVVLLPSLDRVVSFFRALSRKMSLDDVSSSLKIIHVRSPLQSREFIVQLQVINSHNADSLAAVAALLGGLTFTGSAKHFVKYRDNRSPMGYDVDRLHAGDGDFILYHHDFVQAYQKEREIPFAPLALSLSLQPVRDDQLLSEENVLLRVEPGLWKVVLGYLQRNACRCEVACGERPPSGPQTVHQPRRYYLIRGQLSRRMVNLFRQTPGLEVYRLPTNQLAVQLGYQHPLELDSCRHIFAQDSFYLFSGTRQAVDVMSPLPLFVDATTLVGLASDAQGLQVRLLSVSPVGQLNLPLRLIPSSSTRQVTAVRIPRAQLPWLKKLVYLLPPQLLAQYTICFAEEEVFLFCASGIELIPLGELYYQLAPGLLVPAGTELIPHFTAETLLEHLPAAASSLFFFRREDPLPLQIPRLAFGPLHRQVLAQILVQEERQTEPPGPPPTPVSIANDPLGLFPLWGFSDQDQGK